MNSSLQKLIDDNNNTSLLIIIIFIFIMVISIVALIIFLMYYNTNSINMNTNEMDNDISLPIITFYSEPNKMGKSKTYNLEERYYPYYDKCGPDPIGFIPMSAQIENDFASNYKLYIAGYIDDDDNVCGPGKIQLINTYCYNENIYSIINDNGECIKGDTQYVNWIKEDVHGGIVVEKIK